MTDIVIESLGRHAHLVEMIARWHWNEWRGEGDPLQPWIEAHAKEGRLEGIPQAWIAFDDGEPIGSVSLIEHNMDTRLDLTPWLASLFVLPKHRERGVGSSLTAYCVEQARDLGFETLYLYTEVAQDFYAKRGWSLVSEEAYEGEAVAVMCQELGTISP